MNIKIELIVNYIYLFHKVRCCKHMNIIFLTNDELGPMSSQGIFTDLLREFYKNGHSVYAVCANEKKHKKRTNISVDKGINVLRVKTGNVTQVNMIEKGFSTLLVKKQFKKAIKKYLGNIKFDLVLYSTPPITLANVIKYIKKKSNAKSYLLLKDIFPQNAIDLDLFKENGMIHIYFRKVERDFYELSDYIGCMSEANIKYLINNNPQISKNKIELSPNSIEPIKIDVSSESKIKYCVQDKC